MLVLKDNQKLVISHKMMKKEILMKKKILKKKKLLLLMMKKLLLLMMKKLKKMMKNLCSFRSNYVWMVKIVKLLNATHKPKNVVWMRILVPIAHFNLIKIKLM